MLEDTLLAVALVGFGIAVGAALMAMVRLADSVSAYLRAKANEIQARNTHELERQLALVEALESRKRVALTRQPDTQRVEKTHVEPALYPRQTGLARGGLLDDAPSLRIENVVAFATPKGMPEHLRAWINEESEEWAREDLRVRAETLYEDYRDWDEVNDVLRRQVQNELDMQKRVEDAQERAWGDQTQEQAGPDEPEATPEAAL